MSLVEMVRCRDSSPSCVFAGRGAAAIHCLFVLAFIIPGANSALGQGVSAPPLSLTVTRAVELALRQGLDLQIANLAVAGREQDKSIARSALLPQAQFETDDAIARYNLKAQIGVQIPEFPKSIGPFNAVHTGPEFSTPVFDLTLIRQYQEAGHRLAASRDDAQVVREETVLLTVSEYMAHLRAEASVTAAKSRVKLAHQLLAQARDLHLEGVATGIDVSRAEVRWHEEQQQLVDARRDVATSLLALKRILNLPDSQAIVFTDQHNFFRTRPLQFRDPLTLALSDRPELHALAEQAEAAALKHKAVVAESFPALKVSGRWNEQGPNLTTLTPGYEYRLSLIFPLFTSGRLRGERRRTAIAQHQAETRIAMERNRVTEEVRDGEVRIAAALKNVELGRQEVRLANQEVALAEGRFKSGVTDNIEVIAAQDALARANDTEIGALFSYNLARAQLARAVGLEEETYSQP